MPLPGLKSIEHEKHTPVHTPALPPPQDMNTAGTTTTKKMVIHNPQLASRLSSPVSFTSGAWASEPCNPHRNSLLITMTDTDLHALNARFIRSSFRITSQLQSPNVSSYPTCKQGYDPHKGEKGRIWVNIP